MDCRICGKHAPFFTELFDPRDGVHEVIWLCRAHHIDFQERALKYVRDRAIEEARR